MAAVGPSGSGGGGGGEDPYIFEIDEGATRALYGGARYGYVGQPPREWYEATAFRAGERVSETAAQSGTAKSRRIEVPVGFVPGEEVLPDGPHPAIARMVSTADRVGHAIGVQNFALTTYFDYDQYELQEPGEDVYYDNEYEYDDSGNVHPQYTMDVYTWTAPVYPETPPVDAQNTVVDGLVIARPDLLMRQLGFK